MKKLMVALAAIALAGATQAATMSWSVMQMQSQGVEAGWLVALYDSSTSFDYAEAKSGSLAAWYTATTAANTTGVVSINSAGNNNPSGDPFGKGEGVSVYAVIFNAATIADATKYMVSATVSGTSNPSTGANFAITFGNMAATTTANKFLGATWADAPEPTSGLLMLVGFGALALRRRRA